jgi:hypothetical protein
MGALTGIVAQLRSDATELLTTREMAERYHISTKTLRKRATAGTIAAPVRLAKRGASALRWRAQA